MKRLRVDHNSPRSRQHRTWQKANARAVRTRRVRGLPRRNAPSRVSHHGKVKQRLRRRQHRPMVLYLVTHQLKVGVCFACASQITDHIEGLSDRHEIHSGSGEGSTNNTATATDRAAQAPVEKGQLKNHRTKSGGVHELKENGRPTADRTREASPGDTGLGRKSGRIREKGPTTYTAKGDIIRGGKRVNEEIHQQTIAKRARYVG